MSRGSWSSTIRFGRVEIPVALSPASQAHELELDLVDRRDFAPIGYLKFNKSTGEEVTQEQVVKVYRLETGEAVVIDEEDFKRARPEADRALVVRAFVNPAQIRPAQFETPYYLAPSGKDARPYLLLREALSRSRRAAIATGVLRTRERLALIQSEGDVLVLNTLRYAHELRAHPAVEYAAAALPAEEELRMAERLVSEMTESWRPERYRDEYRDQFLAYVRRKAEAGEARKVYEPREIAPEPPAPARELLDLLKESVAQAPRRRPKSA